MSYASTLVLKDRAAANVTFVRLTSDNQTVKYGLQTASLNTPTLFTIGHQMTSSPTGNDRHMVKIAKTVLDSSLKQQTAVLNFTLSVPRNGIVRNDIDDIIAELKEFLVTANVDALLRGEL